MHLKKFEVLAAMQAQEPVVWQLVAALIAQKGWEREEFCKRTWLDEAYFYKALRGDPALPSLPTLIAICVGFGLDTPATDMLLAAAGYKLSRAVPLHRAYLYVIEHLTGQPISVCNEFLKRLHINELGSQNYIAKLLA